MVGRFEAQYYFAHEREVSGERSNGKNERLIRMVGGCIGKAEFIEKSRCQAAASKVFPRITKGNGLSSTIPKVYL
jgi:hypothetical protein